MKPQAAPFAAKTAAPSPAASARAVTMKIITPTSEAGRTRAS